MDDITSLKSIAYINSQVACALIELEGMKALNREREINNQAPAFDRKAFNDLIKQYDIHHNGVITELYNR